MQYLRSLLSVPGNRRRMLEKAPGYGADALAVDLEDSVPIDQKDEARLAVREFLLARSRLDVIYVRVNSLQSGLLDDDLQAIVTPGLVGIQLPKADSSQIVRDVDSRLTHLERERGLTPGSVEMIVSIESVAAAFAAYAIMSAATRVASCIVGVAQNGDLQRDLGYVHSASGMETLYVRSKVILEARAAGIRHPLDGVFASIDDIAGFEASASLACGLGYHGKKVIHPKHVELANRIFLPTPAEVDFQQRVLVALEQARREGKGSTTVDGLMVDVAMIANAQRVLTLAAGKGAARP